MFFKKKKEEESKPEKEETTEIPDDASVSKKVELMSAQLSKIQIQIESLNEVRKSTTERFGALTEQIGELRGQLMDTNKNLGVVEVKSTRAADLVESVHPDKLMIELQKTDGKVEALKANIESNEAMMHNLMDQLKKIRNQVSAFRGMEQVMKMNQEIKDEVMNIKKMAATVERHSDKVETVFSDIQGTYHEYNIFSDTLKDLKEESKKSSSQISAVKTILDDFVKKKEFEKRYSEMESFMKKLKRLEKDVDNERKKYKRDIDLSLKEANLKFEKEFVSARLLSEAFERLLMQKPEIAKQLHLKDYVEKRKDEISSDMKKAEEQEQEEKSENNDNS